jgi:hypothetical protein
MGLTGKNNGHIPDHRQLIASESESGSEVVETESKSDGEVVGTESESDGEDVEVVSEHARVRVNEAWRWYESKCNWGGTGLMRPYLIVLKHIYPLCHP